MTSSSALATPRSWDRCVDSRGQSVADGGMQVASARLRLALIMKCTGSRAGAASAVNWELSALGLLAECPPVNPYPGLCFLSLQWRTALTRSTFIASWEQLSDRAECLRGESLPQGCKPLLTQGRLRKLSWSAGNTASKPKVRKVTNQSQVRKSYQPIRARHLGLESRWPWAI